MRAGFVNFKGKNILRPKETNQKSGQGIFAELNV